MKARKFKSFETFENIKKNWVPFFATENLHREESPENFLLKYKFWEYAQELRNFEIFDFEELKKKLYNFWVTTST